MKLKNNIFSETMGNKPLSDDSISDLSQMIESREARVAILGLGYVGLPLLRAFWDGGHPVMGFDIDTTKIDKIRAGENYLKHLGDDLIRPMVEGDVDRFQITSEPQDLAEADVLILCVPTPLGEHQEPDMTFIESTSETIAGILRPGQLVSLESTTYPGTTREVMLPILEKSGLTCGREFFVAYSPSARTPDEKITIPNSIPKLVGGLDKTTGKLATELYSHAVSKAIQVESAEIAESAKLLEKRLSRG